MNLEQLIRIQLEERYKHFLICGPPLSGKTNLAKKVAINFGGEYVNLLDEICNNHKISQNIDVFSPTKMMDYLSTKDSAKLLVVDQIDFLVHTWTDEQVREFFAYIDKHQNNICYIFIMQRHRILNQEKLIQNSDKGTKRIYTIELI